MKRLLLCLSIAAISFSCSESDDGETLPVENFYALKVGNSWVYKNYKYNNSTKEYEDTGVVDSVSIVSKENLLGVDYFKFETSVSGDKINILRCNSEDEPFEFLREFDGDLIRSDGTIKFTNNNFEERRLIEKYPQFREILIKEETELTVEAGVFTCINSEQYFIFDDGRKSIGLDKYYYSNGFGLISNTCSFASNPIPIIIRRLDSYNIK